MHKTKKRKPKKNSGVQKHQQMLKQQEKEFWQKIVHIAKVSGAYEAFQKIPKIDRFVFSKMRPSAFRVEEAEKGTLNKTDLKELKDYVSAHLRSATFELENGGVITLYDYCSAGLALKHYIRTLEDHAYFEAPEVKKAFATFMKAVNEDHLPRKHLLNYAQQMSWKISMVNHGYFWFEYDMVSYEKSIGYDCFKVHTFKAEIKHFVLDGVKRPAFRVGFPLESAEIFWARVKTEDLGIKSLPDQTGLDVYIQSHALMRLSERLKPIPPSTIHLNLLSSVAIPNVVNDNNGGLMIEYYFRDLKLGYLKAIVEGGTLLIKTFLFITNNGTPEGKKLKELVGLSKEGKKYFHIDQLDTFVESDIKTNKTLNALFTEAGCADLFDFDKHLNEKPEEKRAADAILKYLNVE